MTTASLCGPDCGAPLFFHVLGAIALVGTVSAVAVVSIAALRRRDHAAMLRRTAFRTMLLGVWPAFVVTRVAAQWVLSSEHLEDSNAGWIGVGFAVTDPGILVLAILTLLAWLAPRRPKVGPWLAGLATLYLVALGVAWFAMSAKPG